MENEACPKFAVNFILHQNKTHSKYSSVSLFSGDVLCVPWLESISLRLCAAARDSLFSSLKDLMSDTVIKVENIWKEYLDNP